MRRLRVGMWMLVAAVITAPGCKDGQKKKKPDQFAGVSRDALRAKWQGTWVMPFRSSRPGESGRSSIGNHEIWTVSGRSLSRFDGVSTQSRRLRIIGPCLVDFTWKRKATAKRPARTGIIYRAHYFDGKALHVGDAGGYRHQGTTFACFASGEPRVVVHRGGTCHLWQYAVMHQAGKMDRHPASCSYVTKGDKRYFEVRSPKLYRGRERLLVSGDLLVKPRTPASPARRFPSHAAALKHLTNR